MKKIIKLVSMCTLSVLSGCEYSDFVPEEWAVEPILEFSDNYIVFNSAIASDTISLVTNYKEISTACNDNWCHAEVSGDKSNIVVSVDPNTSAEQRIANVSVMIKMGTKSLTKQFSVIQMGGIWDSIAGFNVYWRHEVTATQKELISQILKDLAFVDGGSFVMGDEREAHKISVSSFYIGKFEITQEIWSAVMSVNPSHYRNPSLPVDHVSWFECFEFVTELADLTNLNISLPTEAQWEYAACGGRFSQRFKYPGSDDYHVVAHYCDGLSPESVSYTTAQVGLHAPNELGLYDMAGNVSEWCLDWYDDYDVNAATDPGGPQTGTSKVVRGGAFEDSFLRFQTTWRSLNGPEDRDECTGRRIVLNP